MGRRWRKTQRVQGFRCQKSFQDFSSVEKVSYLRRRRMSMYRLVYPSFFQIQSQRFIDTIIPEINVVSSNMASSATSAVAQLEHLLTLPPPNHPTHAHGGNHNPMAIAHAVLEHLRESGDEKSLFLHCVLELHDVFVKNHAALTPHQGELFFHCITGCRQVVLWSWKSYSLPFLQGLRDYFMVLGHVLASSSHPAAMSSSDRTVLRTCRLACYTTSVSFWKRGWIEQDELQDNNPQQQQQLHPPLKQQEEVLSQQMFTLLGSQRVVLNNKQELCQYLETLFQTSTSSDLTVLEQGATFANCLVGEFAGKSAVVYRLPLEFHKDAHRAFDKQKALLTILKLSMNALSHVVTVLSNTNTHDPTTLGPLIQQSKAIVQLTMDVIGWEFGLGAFDAGCFGAATTAKTLIRPPVEWKESLAQPEFVRAIFHVHRHVQTLQQGLSRQQQHSQLCSSMNDLAHSFRQLLLQLASLSGPMFLNPTERTNFASHLLEDTVPLLEQSASTLTLDEETPDLLDALQLISRMIANFRLTTLVEIPSLVPLLQTMTGTGNKLLTDQVQDCEQNGGDVDCMEHREWREEALTLLLDCSVLLCSDPWLLYTGTEESRKNAQMSLSGVLRPLYEAFVQARTRMAAMEEHYIVSNNADLDDVREEIIETSLEEELEALATVGRLNLSAAVACLSTMFGRTMPQLQSLWEGSGEVTPQTAALLEEARLLTLYVSHLLTDDNEGETPAIPDSVIVACRENAGLAKDLASAVQALLQFADSQMRKIAENPENRRLSPMLAKTFLLFVHRWAPAYIYPTDLGSSNASNPIFQEWASPDRAQEAVNFCCTMCLNYQCYWPQEPLVQESAGKLIMALAKRGDPVRSALVASPVFHQIVRFHCLTAGMRHTASHEEFDAAIRAKVGNDAMPTMQMVWGYQRLPYQDKARVLTAILVACSDTKNDAANSMITDALKAIHDAFTSLVQALSTKQVGVDDVNAKEMACLCVEMFCGVAHAGEMLESSRIPQFITTYLPQLSGLMAYYAKDLTICETLLRFFRDYTEQFIAILDRDQSLALFTATAELLKSYSAHHCEARVIVSVAQKSAAEVEAEEEQAYGDILCAIQLLINLGAKDFIDACSQEGTTVETSQVTDMIFFGLQQILPLMTQGLLQFPTLCAQFFELVGFMMDTYPGKVCVLPFDLFNSLFESLLFGMSHHDVKVAKCSLQGIASIAKEQLQSQILAPHLTQHDPDIFDKASRRLLTEVVFQNVVVDRVEASAYALLPLAAVDVNRFAKVVHDLTLQVPDEQQRLRLQAAFEKLIQPEALSKAGEGGYEGRRIRVQFKNNFEEFVSEVHSFLVLK